MRNWSIRSLILNALYPVIRLAGDLRIGPAYRAVKYLQAFLASKIVQDGDVLCTYSTGELTNQFISGEFKHSGMYLSGQVIESTRIGVHYTNLFDFLMSKDEFCIMRPLFKIDVRTMILSSLGYVGKPYDYSFEPGIAAFACAELVGQLFVDGAGEELIFTKRKIWGVLTIHPQDFVDAVVKFSRVW